MKKHLILLTIMITTVVTNLSAQAQVIAHRGYWKTDGSAQNSIVALQKADSIACYGSEFDVWMTADGELVVNHDGTFHGKSMEDSTAEELTSLTLKNGENMPTLLQYLETGAKLKTKLVLELKKLSSPEAETEAVEKIVALVASLGLQDRMEYISFSRFAIEEFVRLAPKGTPVYSLSSNLTPANLKAIGCSGGDYSLKVLKNHPEWIEECHRMGMKVNVWTVNSVENMEWCIAHKVDYITTDEPAELLELLNKK